MTRLEIDAMIFANESHAWQFRKYTGLPYITHPATVAEIVRGVGGTPEMLAASWLHDVVEDCGVDLFTIVNRFGGTVGNYVLYLTDNAEGNRATRKAAYRDKIADAPYEAQTIKLADLIDNTRSIVALDPDFARVYLTEKRALLEVLTKGDPRLHKIATRQAA